MTSSEPRIIACLSAKGGVGKSTISRSISTSLAMSQTANVLCDFHHKQQTCVEWALRRRKAEIKPTIQVQQVMRAKDLLSFDCEIVVADGATACAHTTYSLARCADVIIVPTSASEDDLTVQIPFVGDLIASGISTQRIMFVVNFRHDDVENIEWARSRLSRVARVSSASLPFSAKICRANGQGLSIAEVPDHAAHFEIIMDEVRDILSLEPSVKPR